VPETGLRTASGARHFQRDISQQLIIGSTFGLVLGRVIGVGGSNGHVTDDVSRDVNIFETSSCKIDAWSSLTTNSEPSAPTRRQQLFVCLRVLHGLDSPHHLREDCHWQVAGTRLAPRRHCSFYPSFALAEQVPQLLNDFFQLCASSREPPRLPACFIAYCTLVSLVSN